MLSHCEILLAQCEIRLRRVRNRWQNPTFRQPVLGGGTKTVAGAILPSAYKTKSMLPPNYGMGHKHPTRANLCFALKVLKGVGNFFKSFPRKPKKTHAPLASSHPRILLEREEGKTFAKSFPHRHVTYFFNSIAFLAAVTIAAGVRP